jgi:deoxyribodipyrimidine photo-lyase
METKEIQEERVRQLTDKEIVEGDYVLYWMQEAQRAEYNYALEYAVQRANELGKPLLVIFGLMADYPEANLRHYAFLLEGLQDVRDALKERKIKFVVRRGSPDEVALDAGKTASLIVCDMSYLNLQKKWREKVAEKADCAVVQVETEVVVPVELASDKREHAARTLRPRIQEHLDEFLVELEPTAVEKQSLNMKDDGLDLSDVGEILDAMKLDRGGTSEAKKILEHFLESRLDTYVEHRNQPQTDDVSHMSKYLHYGHISPVYVALKIQDANPPQEDLDSYLEELIIRRELSMNFCHYTPDYDQFSNLPDWAKETLEEHKEDEREYLYTREQLENAETHDEYWNAAMNETRYTGYMHNYMRMYWGKKILEWSETPEVAYETTLYLNNKYFIDGRDPNSYANVAWVFGQHDRGWQERAVFGKVRYMSAGGLERKARPEEYVKKVGERIERSE